MQLFDYHIFRPLSHFRKKYKESLLEYAIRNKLSDSDLSLKRLVKTLVKLECDTQFHLHKLWDKIIYIALNIGM